jgi:hypothetical protein
MRTRFILAFLILIFACALQSWFASFNIFIDLILATLIAFAFFFDITELLVFILFGILVINWQPAISIEVILFGIIPLLTFGFYKMFALILWAAVPIAIVVGFLIFYITVAPGMFFANGYQFLMDVFGALIFGEFVFLALTHTHNNQE